MTPRTRRGIVAGIAAAAAAIGAVAFLRMRREGAEPSLGAGVDDVVLTTAAGEHVRWGALKGRPRAVFFGFTNCPVICPVTTYELTASLDRLGEGAQEVAVQFVTLDPERDTPGRLREYFSGFGPRVEAFTGEEEAIARLARSFEVTFRRVPLEGEGYTIDHTATVFLLDRSGAVVDVLAYGATQDVIDDRLRALSGSTSA